MKRGEWNWFNQMSICDSVLRTKSWLEDEVNDAALYSNEYTRSKQQLKVSVSLASFRSTDRIVHDCSVDMMDVDRVCWFVSLGMEVISLLCCVLISLVPCNVHMELSVRYNAIHHESRV